LNLRQLEVLRAVMKRRTTTGAAHELGMSQPAVSNAIKNAEDQLGFLLFDRVNNRLIPTREAETLFAESETLFRHYEALRRKTAQLASGRIGQVSIVITAELSDSLVPGVLQRFLASHTDAHVSIDVVSLEGVLQGIEADVADVGFAMAPHNRPGLVYEPMQDVPMVCICPAGHELTTLPFVSPLDLQDKRLIMAPTTGRLHAMVQDAFSRASARFAPQIEIRFMNIAARCVAKGLGVALIDALTATTGEFDRLTFLPFRPLIPVPLFSIVRKDRPLSRLAKSFIRHARAEVAERARELGPFATDQPPPAGPERDRSR
jgi:DNA-binding transcriptional LysR family regulator